MTGLTRTLPVFLIILGLLPSFTISTRFNLVNRCSYTFWAAILGGGGRVDPGERWTFDVQARIGRIWGRTNCSFDADGRGSCATGDCNGLLECVVNGSTPNTLVEYTLNQSNLDFYDISLVDGFNIPMGFRPTNNGCRPIRCARPSILSQCPAELKAPGGCNNPCIVYKTPEYCCTQGPGGCGPTNLSKFFKQKCPFAYSYPYDDATSTYMCPTGTDYVVTFCPGSRLQNHLNNTTDGTPNHSAARSRAIPDCVFLSALLFSLYVFF